MELSLPAQLDAISLRTAFLHMQILGDQSASGEETCKIVLQAVADNKIQDYGFTTKDVLFWALERCSASFLQQLLHIGVPHVDVTFDDNFRSSPMHVAAVSKVDGFAKCTMLDVRDLSRYDKYGYTPLDRHLSYLLGRIGGWNYGAPKRPGALCRWILEQPECPLRNTPETQRARNKAWGYQAEIAQMWEDAICVRKNWTAARAAWLGAVAVLK